MPQTDETSADGAEAKAICERGWGGSEGYKWSNISEAERNEYRADAKAALAAQPRDDVRELLREARDFLLDTQGTDSIGHRLALRIDTALAPTTQGTDSGLAGELAAMAEAMHALNPVLCDPSEAEANYERASIAFSALRHRVRARGGR